MLAYIDDTGDPRNAHSDIWDGEAWIAPIDLGIVEVQPDGTVKGDEIMAIAPAWEGTGGNWGSWWPDAGQGMVMWVKEAADGAETDVLYRTYDGSTNTYSTPQTLAGPTVPAGDPAFRAGKNFIMIAAGDRVGNHDSIGLAALSRQGDLANGDQIIYGNIWNGTDWDTWEMLWCKDGGQCPENDGNDKPFTFDLEWETNSTEDILHVVLADKNADGLRWYNWTKTSGWSVESALPGGPGGNLDGHVDLAKHRTNDKLMAIAKDAQIEDDYWFWYRDNSTWNTAQQPLNNEFIFKDMPNEAAAFFDGSNPIKRAIIDSVLINDSITFNVFSNTVDNTTIDDTITVFHNDLEQEFNDAATIDDAITAFAFDPLKPTVNEFPNVEDFISFKASYLLADSATVDDSILLKHIRSVDDSAAVDDSITFKVFYNIVDNTTIDDSITGRDPFKLTFNDASTLDVM